MNAESTDQPYALAELNREKTFGGDGTEKTRFVPLIDMGDYERRRSSIADEIWEAATRCGFFQLVNHGIPQAMIDEAFLMSERFFALPATLKSRYPLQPGSNAGWEYTAQVRPSTGTPDQKESYQISLPRMAALWPGGSELPGFKAVMLGFERVNWLLGMKVLDCIAGRLGFEPDFFTTRHDPQSSDYLSTLRLLHYFALGESPADGKYWRAGAHTDFDCLTLLHQRTGEAGLQLCPGKEADTMAWTDIEPQAGLVTCNVGDMLMRWSDDRLLSTLHRVRMPRAGESRGSRYSMGFFCQANGDAIIQGPRHRYAPIAAREYLRQRIAANRL
jgi:isopenicillin N synthase-like dioxygenase